MPFATYFKNLSTVIQNRILTAILVVVISSLYNYGTKFYLQLRNKELQKDIEVLRRNNMRLEIELIKCRTHYSNVRANTDNMPLVYWERDVKTELITYLNPAFEKVVLTPLGKDKYDLLYKDDENVFGKDAKEYKHSFNFVRITGKKTTRTEISHDTLGNEIRWKSTKFPIYENGVMTKVGAVSYMIE